MIAIYNLEPKYFNLALEKIRKYYEDQGEKVDDYKPLWHNKYDKIYCSSIFTWTDKSMVTSDMICGGTGFDLTTKLPPEIEMIKVRKNKGFTTRGCIRKCPFCVVPQKEGYVVFAVGDIYDLWNRKAKKIILYDNNILALPEHFRKICQQIRKESLTVDFNQGLDHKLLNQKIVDELKSLSHIEYRFAFDNPNDINTVNKAIDLLRKNNINRCNWYVLVGFNTSIEEDFMRLNFLRDKNQNAYLQRYNLTKDKIYIPMAQWVNQHHIFHGMTWHQFINHKKNKKYKEIFTCLKII